MSNSIIKFSNKLPWRVQKHGDWSVYVAGFFSDLPSLLEELQKSEPDKRELEKTLIKETFQFSLMIEGPKIRFAATDRTRSFPIFFHVQKPLISNHAQELDENLIQNVDLSSLQEFFMSGYVLSSRTLHRDINALKAGEFLLLKSDETHQAAKPQSYYQYIPKPQAISEDDAISSLGKILDKAIEDTLKIVNGKPIWVPLSGGLDSRLILSKLHEHGYDNLHCFSYGVKNNGEAQVARAVAEKLNMPWHMLITKPKKARSLYRSTLRQDYEEFSHGYTSIPSYVEFEAIHLLKENNLAADDSFLINGQTGDFLSGGHIPKTLYEKTLPTKQDLIEYIIDKHLSLWKNLKTQENKQYLSNVISEELIKSGISLDTKESLISAYEAFEWQERQCKTVLHSQRVYDFFGYKWILPLWHADLMDFFVSLPFDLKYRQNLYMQYLNAYNYKGLFDIPRAKIKTWAKPYRYGIWGVGNFLGAIIGKEAKADFYKKMSYYGHAHNQYALFGKQMYDAHYKDIRNMVALSILDFCERKSLPSSHISRNRFD